MIRKRVPTTSHTVEMSQLTDLNDRLSGSRTSPVVTAGDLGLGGTKLAGADDRLPESARLTRVCWDGPPQYPYIHGHFSTGGSTSLVVDLHTGALNALSHRLSLRHSWGWGSVPS